MLRARAGDLDAFDTLVARHTAIGYRTAVLLGAGDDAQDVLQAAFVKAFRALDGFRDEAAFRPWFLRIVANETHNFTRGRRRQAELLQRARVLDVRRPLDDDPATAAERDESRRQLLHAVSGLPEKDRQVVTFRFLLDLSEAETAAALGWPVGSVKSRTSRALRKLRSAVPPATMSVGSHD
ncbi:MAG: polymerase [Frankiales bacterium]|nr:polymerase [Frankiales bacterium]